MAGNKDHLPGINIGDEIVLFSAEEDEGFISSGGLSEDRCTVKHVKDKDSAFKIYPMITYTATKGLKRRIKRLRQQPNSDQTELNKQLEALQELENTTNETFLSQLEGKPLVYGQIIQFLHVRTSKFIMGRHKEDSNNYLRLEKSGSQKCWFKVVSQDKTVKEGARVLVNDSVKLLHLSSGCFIHQTSWTDEGGNYDVETSSVETSWQLRHFEVGGGRVKGLKEGDAVRFFHQEAGYLSGNRKFEIKCKANQMSNVPTSYNTIWRVEQVHRSDSEITWGQPVRFRLLTCDMYLQVSPESNEDESRVLTLSKDPNDPNCCFMFVALKKESDRITGGTMVLIQSLSKYWIHCADELFGIDSGMKTTRLTEVTCSKKFNHNDAFIIKPASQTQLEKYQFVEQKIPIIFNYRQKLQNAEPLSEEDDQITIEVISELIKFCTNSDSENALTREGETIKAHQSLLNSSEFIEWLIEVAEMSFQRNEQIARLAFRLIKQIAKDNVKNGCLIHRYSHRFLHPEVVIPFSSLGTPEIFVEMFRNNKTLLESLSRDSIQAFTDILQQTRNHHFLQLLSVLCICDDEPLPTNQKMLALELFDSHRPLDEILLKTRFASDTEVFVNINGEEITVEKFTLKEKDPQVLYFERQLILFYTLCKGRNYTGIHHVSKIISFREAFSCLKNEYILPKFRSCYSNILLNVFVDCYPYSRTYSEFHLIWPMELKPMTTSSDPDAISNRPQTSALAPIMEPRKKREIPSLPQVKNPKNLQEFLISYITNTYNFRFDRRQQQIDQPTFFLDVFVLLRYSIIFGFFKNKELCLFPRFKELLEVQPDYNHQKEPRSLPQKYQSVLLQVKYQVCKILESYLDLQMNQFFGEFLQTFPTETLTDFSETSVKKSMIQYLERVIDTSDIIEEDEFELSLPLLQVIKHENDQLSSASMSVLVRLLRSRSREAEIILQVPRVQLLTKPQDKESFSTYSDKYDKMKKITSEKMNSNQKEELNNLLLFFLSECGIIGRNKSTNQRTLANMGLYEGVINILKLPMDDERDQETTNELKGMSDIFLTCYEFLRMFCYNNRVNQKIMFDYVHFMIDQMMRYRNIAANILNTIIEVFQNNAVLCSEINPKMIQPFVKLIVEREKRFDYISFLKIILYPENQLLKQNQNLVLELMMNEKVEDLIIPVTDIVEYRTQNTPRVKRKTKKGKEKVGDSSTMDESSELNLENHLKLVSLLAYTAEGKNHMAEVTCQKMFSVEDCLAILSTHTDFRVRSSYLHFLDEVYLNTETTMQLHPSVVLLATSDQMWTFIESTVQEIAEFTERPLGKFPEDEYHEYIMKVLLSFIKSYYSKCFVSKKATQIQNGITTQLLERLVTLYRNRESEPKNILFNLISCIKILNDHGIIVQNLTGEVANILSDTEVVAQGIKEQNEDSDQKGNQNRDNTGTMVGSEEIEREVLTKIYNSIVYLMDSESERTQFLELLIYQIRNVEYQDTAFKIHCLRTLSAMVYFIVNPSQRKEFQRQIANMEAPIFVIDLLDSKDPSLIEEALTTIIILLQDTSNLESSLYPHTYVTETIMNSFTSRGDEHIFQDIYNIFQIAKSQIKERKNKLLAKKRDETIMKKRLGVDLSDPKERRTVAEKNLFRNMLHSMENDEEMLPLYTDKEIDRDISILHIEKFYPHMLKIFTMLQLMCKGAGFAFREYCRIQEDNYQSFDLVRELVQYLKVLEPLIGYEDNFELAIQCYTTLREFVYSTPSNCEAIINAQILTPLNRTLANSFDEFPHPSHPLELKVEAVELLIALTTQCESPDVINKMIANLDFKGVEAGTEPISKGHFSGNEITLASSCYRFIKGLSEIDTSQNQKVLSCLSQCEENCKSRIGRIELLIEKQLKRLYFPIPEGYRNSGKIDTETRNQVEKSLQSELENDLVSQNIDWTKSSEKVEGFVNWCEKVLVTKEHETLLESKHIANFLIKYDSLWRNISLFLAILINFLIVIFGDKNSLSSGWLMITLRILGVLQTLASLCMVSSYFLSKGVIKNMRQWKHVYDREKCYMLHPIADRRTHLKKMIRPFWRFWLESTLSFFKDGMSLFHICYLILSILGNVISPLFYAYHLFQIIVRSKNLNIIFQALAINKITLALMLALILQVMYVFSILSFVFFQDHYNTDYGCTSVIQCISSNIFYGFSSSGGIFEYLQPYSWGGETLWSETFFWILWILFFYFVLGVILMNVVFAIIVDTFGQLRDKRQRMKEELNSTCLICSIERDKFQRKGKDFQKHIEDDHNPWQYLYFFAYLKEKKEKGENRLLTADEKYIEAKIIQNCFLEIFPIDRALVLEGEEEEEDIVKIYKRLTEMESQFQYLADELESMQKDHHQIGHYVTTLVEDLKKLKYRVEHRERKPR